MAKPGTYLSACSVRSLRVGWKPGDPLPTRIPLLRKGDNPSAKGTFHVTDSTLAGLAAYQTRAGLDRVAIDFQHSTVEGSDEYARTHEPRPVAGFGAVVALDDGSIALDAIQWTSLGQQHAEHYEDLSPVVYHTADGEVRGIHSVALVRAGAVYGLSLLSSDPILTKGNTAMTPEEIAAAITAAVAPLVARLDSAEALLKQAPSAEQLTAASSAAVQPIKDELAVLIRQDAAREKDHLIRCAMLDGKNVAILKPETVTALSVADLKTQLDALKAGEVPLVQRTVISALGAGGTPPAGPSDQQRDIAARLGLDPAKISWN